MYHATSLARCKVTHRKIILIFLALLLVILFQLAFPGRVMADQSQLMVEIMPSSVVLPSHADFEVQVVANNVSSNTLQDLHLSMSTTSNITLSNSPPPVATLSPGAQYVWDVKLSQNGQGSMASSVQFRVDYKSQTQGQPPVAHVAFGSLAVNPETVENIVDVQVQTSLSTLNQQQPGKVFLLIMNKTDFPLMVTHVTPNGPDFIHLEPENFSYIGQFILPLLIPPHQTRDIAIDVSIPGRAVTGMQLLVFEIAFDWYVAGQTQMGTFVATKPIDVGVQGVSELLNLLQIPFLLFFPGYLVLLTWQLCWKFISRREDDKYQLKITWLPSLMIAVLLSIIAFWVYYLLTNHNFLAGYELLDVIWIYLGSILSALVLYSFYELSKPAIQWYKSWQLRRHTPSASDKPIDILRKLQRQHLGVQRQLVELKPEGELPNWVKLRPEDKPHAYLLQDPDNLPQSSNGQQQLWVGPPISVTWKDGISDETLKDEVYNYIWTKDIPQGRPGPLANLLSNEKYNHIAWEVSWRPPNAQPFQVKQENIVDLHSAELKPLVQTGEA